MAVLEAPLTPPHNLEAEQSVLGAVLLSDTALPALIIDENLQPEDFYRESHGVIYRAMLDIHQDGRSVDALTLAEHLKQAGTLESVGGKENINVLASAVPAVSHVRQYAKIVRENAMLRRLLSSAYQIIERVHSHEAPPRELVDIAERTILEVAHDDRRKDFRAIDELLHVELEKLEKLSRQGTPITGTPSGFDDLDNITGGFQPGNLIILAARPSMGKCLPGSALVYDPRSGRLRRMLDVVESVERGADTVVATVDDRFRIVPADVTAAFRNGEQPVFRMKTRGGRTLDATANHPVLTLKGWSPLAELSPRDWIAVPTRLPGRPSTSERRSQRAGITIIEHQAGISAGDLAWDVVEGVELVGVEPTYDITVPGHHNFVANDIVVHNSALMANFAENAALMNNKAVALFSLEMSEGELAQRFIASQASIKGDDLRKGKVPESRWPTILKASARLSEAPLFIDDSSDLSVLDVRAKARRLVQQHPDGLGLVLIDYLQLMRAGGSSDNRVEQIGQISRGLKTLARELEVPVIALSQLNRGVEQRHDKRPVLSDLRESGCLAGETRVYLPDAGEYRRIDELEGRSGFRVAAVNPETWKIEHRRVTRAFRTGTKPVFKVRTALGRTIRATANHKFLRIDGWQRLDGLAPGDHLALPRELRGPGTPTMTDAQLGLLAHLIGDGCTLPRHAIQYTTREPDLAQRVVELATEVFGDAVRPSVKAERSWHQVYIAAADRLTHGRRNPVAAWLDELGIFGLRSHEKRVPGAVFAQPASSIAVFLRHLWATDGCLWESDGRAAIYYATSSERLARDVQSLLLRLGISAAISQVPQANSERDQFHVRISGTPASRRFLEMVGAVGARRSETAARLSAHFGATNANPNRDVIPARVWRATVVPAMQAAGLSARELQSSIGTAYCGSTLYKANLSPERAARVAEAVLSDELRQLSASDVYWDRVVSIEPDGVTDVYDLTVDGLHNFVAEDIIVHNSIEQDADLVMFIYRDEYYDHESEREGIADLIISKHRNGGLGMVELTFQKEYPRFMNYVSEDRY